MNALKLMGRSDDLSADEEARFRAWLKQNPDSTKTDAELRQIWKAQDAGSPNTLYAAARQPAQLPSPMQLGGSQDTLPRDWSMERPPGSDAWGMAPIDRNMEVQPRRSNALQSPTPIAWTDAWTDVQEQPPPADLPGIPGSEIAKAMALRNKKIWDERDIPIPTWQDRIGVNRPANYTADPGMAVAPRRADVDSQYGNTGFVAPGDLRPLPRNALQGPMPIAWTDYTPEQRAELEGRSADDPPPPPGVDASEIPIPTWADRLAQSRPYTPMVDFGMLAKPRRADVDVIQGRQGVVTKGDLLGTPRDTPVDQLPSYQQGTDYVPEDGPAKLHEGEMVIPAKQADRLRNMVGKTLADDLPTVTVKPQRTLSQDEIEKRLRDQGYSPAGAKGIAQNFIRESGGDAGNVTGDHGTSRGLAQWHASRKDELEAFARDQKGSAADPEIQFKFLDKEMKEKFPSLRSQLMASDNTADAESKFRRIFERPASVMWSNDASGRPVLGNDRYRFSDYAMGEHSGRRGTSLLYMDPQDYLDLSPPFDDDPKTSRSGRSLRASVGRGDAVESVPSLDMRVDGQTGTVTGQDGRNRALLAQEAGLDAIPVAVRQKGEGEPTEIAGMSGTILPNDFRKAEHVSRETSADRSILGRAMDLIIPRAEAAEPKPGGQANPFDQFDDPAGAASASPAKAAPNPFDQFDAPAAAATGDHRSVAERVGTGMVDPFVGVAQLTGNVVGGGMGMLPGALGRAGTSLQDFTNRKTAEREAGIQAERGGETGIDWWRLGGNIASPINLIPMGALGRAGSVMGALGRGAVAGGVGALTQPVTKGDFTTGKIEQIAGGAAAGGVLGAAGQVASKALAPTLRKAVDTLMREHVQLTPGQMAGGHVRAVEDTAASFPGLGSQIKIAQRRSVETFNRAAINRSLSDLGLELPKGLHSGHDAINYAHDEFSKAYNSVIPRMTGHEDPTLRQDLTNIVGRAQQQNLPKEYLDQLHDIIGHEIVERFNQGNGTMSGVDAQTVGTQLNALRKALKISPNPYQQRLGRLLGDVDDAMDRMMARRNPVLQAQRDKIDAGYAKFKIVEDAAKRASSMRETPEGTFTPAQLAQAVKGRDTTKDKAAYARGAALMQDLSNAAREVLPSTVPNSGTAERAGLMGLAAGAYQYVSPWLAGGMATGIAAYSNRGVQLTNAIMSHLSQQAGPRRNALAGALQRTGPVAGPMAGIAGANALTDMQSITVRPKGVPQ